MKTVLAALVVSLVFAAPAVASESSYALRGTEKGVPTQAEARIAATVAPRSEAAPSKTVRVILASPYGN